MNTLAYIGHPPGVGMLERKSRGSIETKYHKTLNDKEIAL